EQHLLAGLSIFAGGWSLEAAEAVCDAQLETLASLVNKSLVSELDGRFSMLGTIREYGLERLAELDAANEAGQRHAAYFVDATEGRTEWVVVEPPAEVFDWFAVEQDNLRTALDWLHAQPEAELELRLVVACNRFWYQSGYWSEGRERVEAAR